MRLWNLEALTRPLGRALQGNENGPVPMSIAAKLRDTLKATSGEVQIRIPQIATGKGPCTVMVMGWLERRE